LSHIKSLPRNSSSWTLCRIPAQATREQHQWSIARTIHTCRIDRPEDTRLNLRLHSSLNLSKLSHLLCSEDQTSICRLGLALDNVSSRSNSLTPTSYLQGPRCHLPLHRRDKAQMLPWVRIEHHPRSLRANSCKSDPKQQIITLGNSR
jgi:hypothetical protein